MHIRPCSWQLGLLLCVRNACRRTSNAWGHASMQQQCTWLPHTSTHSSLLLLPLPLLPPLLLPPPQDLTCSGQLSYLGTSWRKDVAFAGYGVPLQVGCVSHTTCWGEPAEVCTQHVRGAPAGGNTQHVWGGQGGPRSQRSVRQSPATHALVSWVVTFLKNLKNTTRNSQPASYT
jgi:hypothetical protein